MFLETQAAAYLLDDGNNLTQRLNIDIEKRKQICAAIIPQLSEAHSPLTSGG